MLNPFKKYDEEVSGEKVGNLLDTVESAPEDKIYSDKEYRVRINKNILDDSYSFKVEALSSPIQTVRSLEGQKGYKGPAFLAHLFKASSREDWEVKAEGTLEDLEKAKELLQE